MKHFNLLIALLFGTSTLIAQIDYTCTFSANVDMDSIQVTNMVSGESRMLYKPDNTITLRQNKQQGNEETSIITINNACFLQKIDDNVVMITVAKATIRLLFQYDW